MSYLLFGIAAWIFLQAIRGFIFQSNRKREQQAYMAYQDSLVELNQNPNDYQAKSRALGFGRQYSSLARDGYGVTAVDEISIQNDINVAVTGSQGVSSSGYPASKPMPGTAKGSSARFSDDIENKLDQLDHLRVKGLLTDEEYEVAKKRVLKSL
jgi:hypothetical protein